MQHRVYTQVQKIFLATLAVCAGLMVAGSANAAVRTAATQSSLVVSDDLTAREVISGKTFHTPKRRFLLGVPPATVQTAPADVTIHTSRRKNVRKGKRKLKTKRVFTYSITSKTDGPVWLQVRNNRLKKTDTLKYFNKRTGKWKKIPTRVKCRQNIVQGQLDKKSATIGLFQKKKRPRAKKRVALRGQASWYVVGDRQLVAAHRTLPFGTVVRVTNTANGNHVDVTINDRGPFIAGRVVDLSKYAFRQLDNPAAGVVNVKVTVVSRP